MIGFLTAAAMASVISTSTCENLTSLSLENTTIETSAVISSGGFRGAEVNDTQPAIPEHCRVTMVLAPTSDSHINVELWLPMSDWNGKFLAVGNGGWAGSIQGYADMQTALRRGYATAATDTGHLVADGPGAMFGLGHPEKIVDFAYRSIHDMTVKSKRLINNFYFQPADYAYFKGCSTGGRQAVMAAQRYPGDFDGIIAGALANRHVHMQTAGAYRGINLARNPDKVIPATTAAMVTEAVMSQCDVLGEGFLNNPLQCAFDFSSLQCDVGQVSESCLTPPQLETVEEYYDGLRYSTGELIFSGQALGNRLRSICKPQQPGSRSQ